ncbi:MAG: site-specific integrase [Proteobacteria bacterium]|nr:site-specific integrase [Pseudomonadota bacterium]
MSEKKGCKRSLDKDVFLFRWLHPHLGNCLLKEVDRERIAAVTQAKLATGVTAGTVNRHLALVRAVLRCAEREWGWLERVPYIRFLPVEKRRVRWLKREEADRLLASLPIHLAEMMRFSLATGLRQNNVTQLKWSEVDMARSCAWIHADEAKGKKAIAVPLNETALAVLRRQEGVCPTYVFTYQGKPVARANNHAWRKALKRVGIENFRWHDLRHTWASWHIQQGTPLHVLQELGGWSDASMVRKYAHLSASHLMAYADSLSGPSERVPLCLVEGTKSGTIKKAYTPENHVSL